MMNLNLAKCQFNSNLNCEFNEYTFFNVNGYLDLNIILSGHYK